MVAIEWEDLENLEPFLTVVQAADIGTRKEQCWSMSHETAQHKAK